MDVEPDSVYSLEILRLFIMIREKKGIPMDSGKLEEIFKPIK